MRTCIGAICFALLAASLPAAAAVDLTGVVQVDVGLSHACAVTNGGALRCWGANDNGQLGDGTTSERLLAIQVLGLASGIASVSTGGSEDVVGTFPQDFITVTERSHTCARTTGGNVKCWGANNRGQLGDGSTTERHSPVDVPALGSIASIAAGGDHTCALTTAGGVKCWGGNAAGQLGDGTTTQRTSPVDVVGLQAGVVAIATAYRHSCALTTGGGVKCWGANEAGQVGDGTSIARTTPTDVVDLGSGAAAIAAGFGGRDAGNSNTGQSCAVKTDGGIVCWGFTPAEFVPPASGAQRLALGKGNPSAPPCLNCTVQSLRHSCGLFAGGEAKCWGSNRFGQLGDGTGGMFAPGSSAPTTVQGLTAGVSSIASGALSSCAVTAEGRVRCWGAGILGNGSMSGSNVPVIVKTTDSGLIPQAITLGATAPIAVGASGTVSATGGDSGNPVTFASQTPGICSVTGSTVNGLTQGKCILTANQAGNASFDPAPEVTFAIRIGDLQQQSITFGPAPSVVVGGEGLLSATASSGLAVEFGSNTESTCHFLGSAVISGVSAGSCTVRAMQPGDGFYAAAPQVTQTFPIAASGTVAHALTVASGAGGSVSSSPAGISCGSTCAATFASGTTVTLTATPDAGNALSQWGGSCSGNGPCVVTLDAARSVSATFAVAPSLPRPVNVATRGQVLTGNNVMIAGFIVGGSSSKTVVVRARGPSLASAGITNALADPRIQLVDSANGTTIAINDDWGLAANAAQVTASGFAPSDAKEAAILASLAPGAYTAIASGTGGGTGVGIVEVFEVDNPGAPLVNIATRGQVLTGNDVMIAGFVIDGAGPRTVTIRARGPTLSQAGIFDQVLANPQLQLFHGSSQIAFNDNWMSASNAADITASGLAPSDPAESAIRITLHPGAYTAIVTGVGGGTGVGIVEVFAP